MRYIKSTRSLRRQSRRSILMTTFVWSQHLWGFASSARSISSSFSAPNKTKTCKLLVLFSCNKTKTIVWLETSTIWTPILCYWRTMQWFNPQWAVGKSLIPPLAENVKQVFLLSSQWDQDNLFTPSEKLCRELAKAPCATKLSSWRIHSVRQSSCLRLRFKKHLWTAACCAQMQSEPRVL